MVADDIALAGGVDGGLDGAAAAEPIHVRKQQRGGRKWDTLVTGLPTAFNYKKILSALKKGLNCNGSIVEDETFGTVIQLQGDQVQEVATFLFEEGIAEKHQIKAHVN